MKIYFCGSIHGGRQDAELYSSMINDLKSKYGEVLTEYVGATNAAEEEINIGSKEAHTISLRKLNECDVAEVTQPSLGVGYEIGRATAMGKKILCLYRPNSGKKLSCMIDGLHDGDNVIVKYYDGDEYKEILKSFFGSL